MQEVLEQVVPEVRWVLMEETFQSVGVGFVSLGIGAVIDSLVEVGAFVAAAVGVGFLCCVAGTAVGCSPTPGG